MSYKYKSLLQESDPFSIRLLTLHPGILEPMRCSIEVVSLDYTPQYYALSYCWGTTEPSRTLLIGSETFLIRENLHGALRHLRRSDKSCKVWADAVCINQADTDEKNVQVQLMARIYANAEKVKIWLGEMPNPVDDWNSYSILRELSKIGYALIDAFGGDSSLTYSQRLRSIQALRKRLPPFSDPRWKSLQQMFRAPWFSRVWVLQEVCLAKRLSVELVIGTLELNWVHFTAAMYSIEHVWLLPRTSSSRMMSIRQWRDSTEFKLSLHFPARFAATSLKDQDDRSLYDLLKIHCTSRATDPRDKIYALINLANDRSEKYPDLVQDYSLDTSQVYMQAATSILVGSQTLDILSLWQVDYRANDVETLPSWVPDWRACERGGEGADSWVMKLDGFNPSSERIAPGIAVSGHKLLLSGLVLGKIMEKGFPRSSDNATEAIRKPAWFYDAVEQTIKSASLDLIDYNWEEIAKVRSNIQYITGEPILDAYLITTHLGNGASSLQSMNLMRMTDRIIRMKRPWRWVFMNLYFRGLTWLAFPLLILYKNFAYLTQIFLCMFGDPWTSEASVVGSVGHQCLIRTCKGYLGMVPKRTRVGDSIVICRGGKVPLILRETKLKGEWTFVGDCYVHGVMHGEAFEESKCEPIVIV
jgi:hypothetical protein